METIGNLMDQLSVTNIRIWMAEDIKRNPNATAEQIVRAVNVTNSANQMRTDLIQLIDEKLNKLGMGELQKLYSQGDSKMYGK